jgi:hypothetical protein
MIAQVLNRAVVLDNARTLQEALSSLVTDFDDPAVRSGVALGLELEDLDAALAMTDENVKREESESSGQDSFPPLDTERRGSTVAPLDDFSFFSRDHVISNIQSALEEWLERDAELEEREVEDDRRDGDAPAVTDRIVKGLEPSRTPEGRRLFGAFEVPSDPRWAACLLAKGLRLFRKKHPFNPRPAERVPIADNARVLLVGDWGTGLPRARKVADEMRAVLDEGKGKREQHVIHLGDVYYSGWAREYEQRFLRHWPVKPHEAEQIGSWSLNGNHDMYSGGHGYYEVLLQDVRFARQQQSSLFQLQNTAWRIFGLDSAWEDNALKEPQAQWLGAELEKPGGKALLLSHHQLFSAYEEAGNKLKETLSQQLQKKQVRAWFWGHEHRCMTFKPWDNLQYGRCVGHGGVPVYMGHNEAEPCPEPGEYEYREYLDKGIELWALFGFAVLDFDGPKIHVRYIDENGRQHKDEWLTAA